MSMLSNSLYIYIYIYYIFCLLPIAYCLLPIACCLLINVAQPISWAGTRQELLPHPVPRNKGFPATPPHPMLGPSAKGGRGWESIIGVFPYCIQDIGYLFVYRIILEHRFIHQRAPYSSSRLENLCIRRKLEFPIDFGKIEKSKSVFGS